MEINTVEIEPLRVVGLAHAGSYQEIGKTFTELNKWAGTCGLHSAPLVALYYDDPHQVPVEKLRSLAGVIVQADVKCDGERIEETQIPGGRYAMASFAGDYTKLGKAWEEFYGSVSGSGLTTKADICFERYINTPADTAPDQLITELYAPLAG